MSKSFMTKCRISRYASFYNNLCTNPATFSDKGTHKGICAHLSKTQRKFGIYAFGESNQPVSQDLVFEPLQLQNLGELYREYYYSIISLERGRKGKRKSPEGRP